MSFNKLKAAILTSLISIGFNGLAQKIEQPSILSKTRFAIVVDRTTYHLAKDEIEAYKRSIEDDGLGTYIVYDDWESPEEVRDVLHQLYRDKNYPLEGTVLVGDIPIPMVRDAQFLTSAFKMNQKIRWDRSSVPSDRYYDDFDLQFEYLKQDTAIGKHLYHYYSLKAESPQFIEMDIYSARIKPPIAKGENMAQKIKEYLNKIVFLRQNRQVLDDMIASYGHGYNSNAVNSLIGESLALKAQFPQLFTPKGSIKFLNHRQAEFLKFDLLTELKREGIDLAYMTGHGTESLQLLSGYPAVSNPQPAMQNVARYLRGKMRNAKEDGRDLESVKLNFKNSLGVSDKWFEDAFSEESIIADSIYNENLDIQISDLKDANIQATVVYLNSCLMGAFHLDDYIAGYYPFSDNQNVAAIANSIGVLQDLWPTELMGLLSHGYRLGNWLKHIAYLETHILGDPTFHFASPKSAAINEATFFNKNINYWKSKLKDPDADIKALALVKLSQLLPEKEASPILKSFYFGSAQESTRMQAFQLLSRYENDDFMEVLHAAKSDPYEYIRRRSTYYLTDFGSDEFVKDLIQFAISDPHSERTTYRLNWAIQFMNPTIARREVNTLIRNNPSISQREELADRLDQAINRAEKRASDIKEELVNPNLSEKEKLSIIHSLRLYRHHSVVPNVIALAQNPQSSEAIRIAALEALGWFTISYQKESILAGCEAIIASSAPQAVKNEALKTKNRIRGNSHKI